jgi:hypothetical protein
MCRVLTILLAISLSLAFVSCKKYRAKRISGFYECEVNSYNWGFYSGRTDTTYTEMMEITRDGENIEFNHKTIPANDLWKKSYRKDEGGRYYFTMEIIEDRLIYHAEGGGRGGGFEQDIVGKKIENVK